MEFPSQRSSSHGLAAPGRPEQQQLPAGREAMGGQSINLAILHYNTFKALLQVGLQDHVGQTCARECGGEEAAQLTGWLGYWDGSQRSPLDGLHATSFIHEPTKLFRKPLLTCPGRMGGDLRGDG